MSLEAYGLVDFLIDGAGHRLTRERGKPYARESREGAPGWLQAKDFTK